MMRSAPAVMVPELTAAFGVTAAGLTTMVGLFYYGYAPFSLVAGVAMDQLGPRKVVPLGCALMGVGALLFATGDPTIASFGRFLQGCAGVFALIGAAYIATTNFPASRAATLIGATQMFGMAGGSAGQFLVGPAIGGGLAWNQFWMIMGIIGPLIALALWYFIPARKVEASPGMPRAVQWAGQAARRDGSRVPQSAVDLLRPDRRIHVPADDDLRHGLGRALPPGKPRRFLFDGGAALGVGAVRLDHRLSAARVASPTGSAAASR